MILHEDDVYIIRIQTIFGTYYWTENKTEIFTIHPLKAARFHDLQTAVSITKQLNRVLFSSTDSHFRVAHGMRKEPSTYVA